MTRISSEDSEVIEKAIYLPLLLKILEKDKIVFEKGNFKLAKPYIDLVEVTIRRVRDDYIEAKKYMRKNNIKIEELGREGIATMYRFYYKGYVEDHNYVNHVLRNNTEKLLNKYLVADKTNEPC